MKKIIKLSIFFICLCFICRWVFADSIVNSKHNLSVSGPGEIKAVYEKEVCIFCHAPHSSTTNAPLWNRYDPGQVYTPYSSSTLEASVGQPTGASRVCLSCHDGTVALGSIRSESNWISLVGGVTVMPEGKSKLGIDLSDDHPVSFTYDSALSFNDPEIKAPPVSTDSVKLIQLDKNSQLQCTSCHNPHDDEYGDFLNVYPSFSALCIQCHDKEGWSNCSHNTSWSTWNGVSPDPWFHTEWETVAANGCENCHNPHSAEGKERLLNYANEEQNCLACHNGNVAGKDINAEFNKTSIHSIGNTLGVHDPAESALVSSRHVECADCHNAHAVNDQDSSNLAGSLRLIKGISSSGTEVSQINYEYELCFRCHGDTASTANIKAHVDRQYSQTNTRLEFDPANASYHPIENIGKNPDVPSLISPYTTSSIIKCSDCHNNNSGPNNSGTGPNGPHGSNYEAMLERQLVWKDNTVESYDNYALCYKCHDRNSILLDRSFTLHNKHIKDKKAPCTTCHDPHGASVSHLINFDRNIVSPATSGRFYFEDNGRFMGRCFLKCHNKNHDPAIYPEY